MNCAGKTKTKKTVTNKLNIQLYIVGCSMGTISKQGRYK